jgi:RNA polymerase sigma-70 factor (ECF subfamily)
MLTITAPQTSVDHELANVREGLDYAAIGTATEAFSSIRPRLLAIAHRILGSWAEAEDTVQDAWLRWQLCDRTAVRNSTAFLVTMVTRLAINTAESARVRHEWHDVRWLPEPADTDAEPSSTVERDEALDVVIQLLVERLSPIERAAFVLRHAFDYPYERIAQILRMSEVNARQIVSRAGKHLARGHRRPVTHGERRELVRTFVVAARRGEMGALEDLFAAEVLDLAA